MDTIRVNAAAVTGARHLRAARNGQDAAATWVGDGAAAVVVCDGCGSSGSSEVGARLGARLFAAALGRHLGVGTLEDAFAGARADVVRAIAAIVEPFSDREAAVHEMFLFTIVAGAWRGDEGGVWGLGDGAYAFAGGATRELGPFADNEPPYLAYDLIGEAARACFEPAPTDCRGIVVATDGALALVHGVAHFATTRMLDNPDVLRRVLAMLARTPERIDWDERRVVRTPAVFQDDCAIGVLLR
jgi:hypothetical protein